MTAVAVEQARDAERLKVVAGYVVSHHMWYDYATKQWAVDLVRRLNDESWYNPDARYFPTLESAADYILDNQP